MSLPNACIYRMRLWLARTINASTGESWRDRLCSGLGGLGRLGRARHRLPQDALFEFRGRQRRRKIEALALLAAHPAPQIAAGGVLDAFGDDGKAQKIGERDGADDDRRVVRARPQLVHEGLVDLEPVDRKLFQIGQAGIAGAEIVERDLHAELLHPPERLQRPLVVLEQNVFGDFQLKQMGRELRVLENAFHRARKIAGLNERGRDVDAEADGLPVALPLPTLAAGGFHDPERRARRDRGNIDERHEVGRRQQTAGWMAPANQRLGAQELAVAEANLRLIEQLELVALERMAELCLQRQSCLDLIPDLAREDDVSAPASSLGPIEREVGVAKEFVRRPAMVRIERNTNADIDPQAGGANSKAGRLESAAAR